MKYTPSLADFVSLSRIPLAFAFIYFFEQKAIAALILVTSWLSDIVDGYLARENGKSMYGYYIDAATDKFFVLTIVLYLLYSNSLSAMQTMILIMRDAYVILLSVFVYGLAKKRKADYVKRNWESRLSGKITTGLQFITILAVMSGASNASTLFYIVFIAGAVAIFDYTAIVIERLFSGKK